LGFCETLIDELVAEDTAEFRSIFPMDKAAFDRLLNMLLPLIERVDTTMTACTPCPGKKKPLVF